MKKNFNGRAIIIGAGPAGLTAAHEFLVRTNIQPIIFEQSAELGGIARTIKYKGNRIDIGGHRFFSKSDRVMDWWQNILPLQALADGTLEINYQNKTRNLETDSVGPDPEKVDKVMLVRQRLSRIFFLRKFFAYPISLSWETVRNLGVVRLTKILISYLKVKVFPVKPEVSLEDFFINRFGRELYLTFFKDYTEKVWGVPCAELKADWGAQRIKGLSITKAVTHAAKSLIKRNASVGQKGVETSLIERFLYPKYGPGQMWETVASMIEAAGGEIHLQHNVVGLDLVDQKIKAITVLDVATGVEKKIEGDYFFSTMPICDLVKAMGDNVPVDVKRVAAGLKYRDFITVGLLLKKMKVKNTNRLAKNELIPDNWIYIQERDVKIGRLQIFNNWSPYLVKDPNTVWLGLEYFCNEGDELWQMPDADFSRFAAMELSKIGMIDEADVLDSVVIRVPKTYPAYYGTYEEFDIVKNFVNQIDNLFLVGRNGMHRYNNQDHSMLTAMVSVDNIINNIVSKDNIWQVNTEQEYHEEKPK